MPADQPDVPHGQKVTAGCTLINGSLALFVWDLAREDRLIIPVTVPGRLTTVSINVARHEAAIESRETGLADALVVLHKSPGQHLANIRMNWFYMHGWCWCADGTVWLLWFISMSGINLWYALRVEWKVGLTLLLAGATSCFGIRSFRRPIADASVRG